MQCGQWSGPVSAYPRSQPIPAHLICSAYPSPSPIPALSPCSVYPRPPGPAQPAFSTWPRPSNPAHELGCPTAQARALVPPFENMAPSVPRLVLLEEKIREKSGLAPHSDLGAGELECGWVLEHK